MHGAHAHNFCWRVVQVQKVLFEKWGGGWGLGRRVFKHHFKAIKANFFLPLFFEVTVGAESNFGLSGQKRQQQREQEGRVGMRESKRARLCEERL